MAQLGKGWAAAAALRSDELRAVLGCLGDRGNAQARLDAVVALLTGNDTGEPRQALAGAFASTPASVTLAFTSGLHNCLRGQPVNGGNEPTDTHRRLRTQC